jgi:hypothetical protein
MIVNLLGEVITPKFDFPYNLHGIDFLKNKLQSACDISQAKKLSQGIPPRPQILALESTGHYHENLVASLVASGYDITILRGYPRDPKSVPLTLRTKEITFMLRLMPLT